MNRIVLGIGTSHSPLLTFDAENWLLRAEDDRKSTSLNLPDGRFLSYAELLQERGERYRSEAELSHLSGQSARAQQSLDLLADALERAAPDVVIIVGDDHEELFRLQAMPSLAVYYGDELVMHPWNPPWKSEIPGWFQAAMRGYAMDAPHRFPGQAVLARALIAELMQRNVDVGAAAMVEDPLRAGLGHAFGFPIRRLFRDRAIPVIPVLLNTYYPPNNVGPRRCHELGRRLSQALLAIPGDNRIAIIASGGLSHFVTDAEGDRAILDALRDRRSERLCELSMAGLQSGSSETLCWIMLAGAVESLGMDWCDYIPVYRTPAGSGIGLGFAIWR